MSEEAKTYVFGGSDSQWAPLMAAMNNGGFGGNSWWVILFLIALFGRNGFGGNDCGQLFLTLSSGLNSNLVMDAIAGNSAAIGQLSQLLSTSTLDIQNAICSLNQSICLVGNQVGMSGLLILNAIATGNCSIISKLLECCCENRLLTTLQGYESRIAIADLTATLGGKIDLQSLMITALFCALKEREMLSKIDSLIEANSTLKSQIDNAQLTATITGYVNSLVAPLATTVNEIKAAQPPTVAVPYPQLSAVPTSYLCGYGYPYINQSIWS